MHAGPDLGELAQSEQGEAQLVPGAEKLGDSAAGRQKASVLTRTRLDISSMFWFFAFVCGSGCV